MALEWDEGSCLEPTRPISYLIEQFVVETTVYPVDAHVGEE